MWSVESEGDCVGVLYSEDRLEIALLKISN